MSDENKPLSEGENPQRTVRMKLDGKFGVSEERKERGFRGPDSRVTGDRNFARPAQNNDYRDRGGPSNDRPAFGDRNNNDRAGGFRNDRPAFGDRNNNDRAGGFRNDRPAFGDRNNNDRAGGFRNDRPAFGDRNNNDRAGGFRNDRPAFGDRNNNDRAGGFRNDRPAFGDRNNNDRAGGFRNDRPAFGDRNNNDRAGGFRNDRPAFGDRNNNDRTGGFRNDRPAFGDRNNNDRTGGFRNDRPAFGDRNNNDRGAWNADNGGPVFRQRHSEEQPELAPDALTAIDPQLAAEVEAERDPPWFRRILALATEKGREREEQFLAEGVRVVLEMIQYHPDIVNGIYVTEGHVDVQLQERAQNANLRIHELTEEQMVKLSTTVTGPGVVAVCRTASRKPDYDRAHVITMVDAIQDPGNLGALFRTSLGFGSGGMILGKGTVNPFNPKVVRGSSGTFLRVPFEHGVDLAERIQFLRQKGYCIIATDLHAKQNLADISPRKLRKVALIMGNEGMGAEKGLIEQADEWVRIPMGESLDSLNVSVAHGILSFQLAQLQDKVS